MEDDIFLKTNARDLLLKLRSRYAKVSIDIDCGNGIGYQGSFLPYKNIVEGNKVKDIENLVELSDNISNLINIDKDGEFFICSEAGEDVYKFREAIREYKSKYNYKDKDE